jgi:hypothetical protein
MENLKSGILVQVHGFVMLKGLNQGIYKVLYQDEISYTFAKRKSKKPICRHYKNSVNGMVKSFADGNNNGIQILN